MSRKIESARSERTLDVGTHDEGREVYLLIGCPHNPALSINVRTADLLAAIEAEGIGVVVEGALPEVDPERPGYSGYVGLDGPGSAESSPIPLLSTPEAHDEYARRHLALAAYLRAHPPEPEVDEADVEALAEALDAKRARRWPSHAIARALLASGRVTVTR